MSYLKTLIETYGIPPGKCLYCGKCCAALSLNDSPEVLKRKLVEEEKKLEKDPSHRHAELMRLFIGDMKFILSRWTVIPAAEATQVSPALERAGTEGRTFYSCAALGADKKCREYNERPQVCRGYPWYDDLPSREGLINQNCGHEPDLDWWNEVQKKEIIHE